MMKQDERQDERNSISPCVTSGLIHGEKIKLDPAMFDIFDPAYTSGSGIHTCGQKFMMIMKQQWCSA